ncbi:MAG: hypothetical protein IKS90_03520 [Clostridia bacterium]|nr:hypothetical protein [Clostridia bacterium]
MNKLVSLILILLLFACAIAGCRPSGIENAATNGPTLASTDPEQTASTDPKQTPAADPTLPPAPEADDAFKIAARINEVHGLDFIKDTSESRGNNTVYTFFSASNAAKQAVSVGYSYTQERGYYIDYAIPKMLVDYQSSQEYAQWLQQLDIPGQMQRFADKEYTITAQQIKDAGCTATEGEDYFKAVAECYGAMLAELFASAPEGAPMRLKQIDLRSVEILPENSGPNGFACRFSFAVCPEDVYAFWEYTDLVSEFITDENDPYFGRMFFGGKLRLSGQSDGSWSGTARFQSGE